MTIQTNQNFYGLNEITFSRLHITSKCHPGVFEERLVPVTKECCNTNLILDVFKTYTENLIKKTAVKISYILQVLGGLDDKVILI